ncbi:MULTISPECIES: DMT family transporter [unclassified Acinetobacter]|uniref:DMT family transporter n=1 Tax=unclassified Acinetobacter TaxID=196816 RepID=UPI002934C93B|nr:MULTISPECIES: SMR family transporter [unclassified Acinetobacter]WOE32008.1 SMR family transporter [Acinetobacter sp. SAAs470]WOE37476.1 SMR family transporter [Acinetobacter sp. SAAs474]
MNHVLFAYSLLGLAIISEVIGSTFLVKSQSFTKLFPSLMVLILFGIAFYLLSHVIKTIPLGIAYAIWGGVGIVLTSIVGYVLFKQTLDLAALIGITLIIAGVIVINLFSKSAGH